MSEITKEVLTTKEYNKRYYIEHREKMVSQMKNAYEPRIRGMIVDALNNGSYKRFPYAKLRKYDIVKKDNVYV